MVDYGYWIMDNRLKKCKKSFLRKHLKRLRKKKGRIVYFWGFSTPKGH
jgi:hypothetical protein